MWGFFSTNSKKKEKEAKAVILKQFFGFSEQKKAVAKAARESAKDQRMLVEKYQKLVKVSQE